MPNQEQETSFFWRSYLPVALLAVVLFGFPWLAIKFTGFRDLATPECAPEDQTAPAEAEPVQGRAPGSSDHASPIRRTEARAERTLDPARTETASARECGAASPPRAPEPSAARVG